MGLASPLTAMTIDDNDHNNVNESENENENENKNENETTTSGRTVMNGGAMVT